MGIGIFPVSEPNGGHWVEHSVEAAGVRYIFQAYAERGLKISEIAAELNQNVQKLPPRGFAGV